MEIKYNTSFFRDAKKSPFQIHSSLKQVLEIIEQAASLKQIPDLKKLKGHKTAYRVKLNDYRICFYYENDILTFARFLPRKEVYRFFP